MSWEDGLEEGSAANSIYLSIVYYGRSYINCLFIHVSNALVQCMSCAPMHLACMAAPR